MTSLDLALIYKALVSDLAIHLQLLDAAVLQPEVCTGRVQKAFDRWASAC